MRRSFGPDRDNTPASGAARRIGLVAVAGCLLAGPWPPAHAQNEPKVPYDQAVIGTAEALEYQGKIVDAINLCEVAILKWNSGNMGLTNSLFVESPEITKIRAKLRALYLRLGDEQMRI